MRTAVIAAALLGAFGLVAEAGTIELVNPSDLPTNKLIYADFASGGFFANHDPVLQLDGASFAERFAGQTLTFLGNTTSPIEILSGTPEDPLSLQIGGDNGNLIVANYGLVKEDAAVYGDTVPHGGSGAIAALFDQDLSAFSLSFAGSAAVSPAAIHLQFFQRDGSLIDSITFPPSGDTVVSSAGFRTVSGDACIAGFSMCSEILEGVGISDLRIVTPTAVPLPGSGSLLLLGIVMLGFARRGARSRGQV